MQLTHEFTVPATLQETWEAFNDIESVAVCFPGASVSSVEGDTFQGSCKVKLGPIALVYNGSGTFVEKDRETGTMKIEAKGKDKRGNGTAGADVVATMSEAGGSTAITVVTDLKVTGKPAQFGRGVMQDVSDKLLGQFVKCLEAKLGGTDPTQPTQPTEQPVAAGPGATDEAASTDPTSMAGPTAPSNGSGPQAVPPPAEQDDALDLGATVLPVLLKSYGPQIGAGLGLLLVLALIRKVLRGRD